MRLLKQISNAYYVLKPQFQIFIFDSVTGTFHLESFSKLLCKPEVYLIWIWLLLCWRFNFCLGLQLQHSVWDDGNILRSWQSFSYEPSWHPPSWFNHRLKLALTSRDEETYARHIRQFKFICSEKSEFGKRVGFK